LIPIQKDLQKSCFEDFYFFNKRLDDVMKDLQKFWSEDFHTFNERLDDVMKDLSFSSTKDLMM